MMLEVDVSIRTLETAYQDSYALNFKHRIDPNKTSPTNSLWAVHAMHSKSCQNRRPGTCSFDFTVAKMVGFH